MKEFDFEKRPIVEIANEIIMDAVKKNSSDIHFDPYKDKVKKVRRPPNIISVFIWCYLLKDEDNQSIGYIGLKENDKSYSK